MAKSKGRNRRESRFKEFALKGLPPEPSLTAFEPIRSRIANHRNLEEAALFFAEVTVQMLARGSEIEHGLAFLEDFACLMLGSFISELPKDCSAADARTWSQTRQALDDVLGLWQANDPKKFQLSFSLLHAAAVLAFAEGCREGLEAGDLRGTVTTMHRAGHSITLIQLALREMHEQDLERWHKEAQLIREQRARGGGTRGERYALKKQAAEPRAKELQRDHDDWSIRSITRQVMKEMPELTEGDYGISEDTLYRHLLRMLPGSSKAKTR